ncbi:type II toxin-antitoxin system RelE/ParE family toxin [Nostoc sp.]|uniref:type II toxin-antitoxin system RelE/ParE family toxin n=1 Tax=Nostoc sp. TaxID=1180 RepID=UPI002FF4FAB0
MQYVIAVEASQDLDDILDYFLQRNIDAGERFIREFNKKCQEVYQHIYENYSGQGSIYDTGA